MVSSQRSGALRDDRSLYQLYLRYMQQANDYLLSHLRSARARQHLMSFHHPLNYDEFCAMASPDRLGAERRAEIEAILAGGFRTEFSAAERAASDAWLRAMVAA